MPDKKERKKGNGKIAVYEVPGNLLNNNSLWIKISNPEGIILLFLMLYTVFQRHNFVFVKVCSDLEKAIRFLIKIH